MTDNMAEDIANNLFDMENEMTGFTMFDFNAVATTINRLVVAGHVTREVAHSMIAVYLGSLAKDEIVSAVEEAERTDKAQRDKERYAELDDSECNHP